MVRLAPHEAMKVGQHLFAAASQKGKVLRALVGDPGRVTAHLRPSCGGRLIAALVTRPTSAPGGPVASSCLSPASPGQGPAAPGAQLSPDSASIQTGARMPSVLYVLHFPRAFTTNEQLKELLLLRSEGMCPAACLLPGLPTGSDYRICLQSQSNGSNWGPRIWLNSDTSILMEAT